MPALRSIVVLGLSLVLSTLPGAGSVSAQEAGQSTGESVAPTIGRQPAGPPQSRHLRLDRDTIYADETATLYYSYPSEAKAIVTVARKTRSLQNSKLYYVGENNIRKRDLTTGTEADGRGAGAIEFDGIEVEDTLKPFTARLHYSGQDQAVDELHWYVINPIAEQPDILQLDRRRFLPKEFVTIPVQRPRLLDTESQVNFGLYKRAGLSRNGAALMPQFNMLIEKSIVSGIEQLAFEMPAAPGDYELQVRSISGFVLDREAITVDSEIAPVGLRLETDEPIKVGKPFRALLTLPGYDEWKHRVLAARLERLESPGNWVGAWREITPETMTSDLRRDTLEVVIKKHPHPDVVFNPPGRYRLRALWRLPERWMPGGYSEVLAGEVEFDVGPPDIPVGRQLMGAGVPFVFPEGPHFFADDEKEVILESELESLIGSLTIELHKVDSHNARVDPFWSGTPAPIQRWEEVLAPVALALPSDLAPGIYKLLAFGGLDVGDPGVEQRLRQQGQYPPKVVHATSTFLVFPPREQFGIEISSGTRVVIGRPVTFTASLPEVAGPFEGRFTLNIVRLESAYDDCRIQLEQAIAWSDEIATDRSLSIWPSDGGIIADPISWQPGRYEARLYYSTDGREARVTREPDLGQTSPISLLARVGFDVVYDSLPGALQLMTLEPREGETVKVRVTLPENASTRASGASADGSYHLNLRRRSEVAASGALRPSVLEPMPHICQGCDGAIVADAPSGSIVREFTLPFLLMGPYELALIAGGAARWCSPDGAGFAAFTAECEVPIYDRLAFDLLPSGWQGPLTLGLGEDDLDGARTGRVFPETGPADNCVEPEFDVPPTLSIARWYGNDIDNPDDNEYRPVEGIHLGHPFVVEARFETPPPEPAYSVRIGEEQRAVVRRDEDDPLLYRSDFITLMRESQEQPEVQE